MLQNQAAVENTINHLFRHQSGKMLAVITRIFGPKNLDLAEDVVQETLLTALELWKIKGIPQKPESWLFIVAKNKALNLIRKQRNTVLFGDYETDVLLKSGYTAELKFNQLAEQELIKDDQLRMMFACCHPDISQENQITLILKTLCGFSITEIARAFLSNEETISKRLYRTKAFFRQNTFKLEIPSIDELKIRTDTILNAIYLLFNEGYKSTHANQLIRQELIDEAITLCNLLIENKHTQLPEVYALMALMYFHSARSNSRLSNEGEIVLLEFQDRTKWNQALINKGSNYLNKAAFGKSMSTYHLQAAIAFEHCKAKSFNETNWQTILELYNWLCKLAPSPIAELNRIIAVLQTSGPVQALNQLENLKDRKKLETYYLYFSLCGEIHAQMKQLKLAKQHYLKAIELTQSESEKKMLLRKIAGLAQD